MQATEQNEPKKALAKEIIADYYRRSEQRKAIEAQWRLNADFVAGKQNGIIRAGTLIQSDKRRFWEERAVFNHIAGIYETRLGKMSRSKPTLSVRPPRGDERAVASARLSGAVLESAAERVGLSRLIGEATMWSELTGSAFYKVSWDRRLGVAVGELDGEEIREGEVRVDVVSPYEIYPDSLSAESVDKVGSIIHAKALPVGEIASTWGVSVEEGKLCGFSSVEGVGVDAKSSPPSGYALVIERFTRPNSQLPLGRYEVVAGGELVYEGDLPISGDNGERELPFIRQCCAVVPGRFFGVSPIERAIPIQRAYNAVKNRKHEFMNRLASGVLVVEDGSVDTSELEEDGLEPGKIIVYRQGSTAPKFLELSEMPDEFSKEEQSLLEELSRVSGVSELMRTGGASTSVTSGSALQLLLEQDDVRISVAVDNVNCAAREVGRRILALYSVFASQCRLTSVIGLGEGLWSGSDLVCREVAVETSPELEGTRSGRRTLILELFKAGLFDSADGKISQPTRRRILQALGYGHVEQSSLTHGLHEARASRENVGAIEREVKPYDDHAVHIEEHVSYLLERELDAGDEASLSQHVAMHEAELRQKEDAYESRK